MYQVAIGSRHFQVNKRAKELLELCEGSHTVEELAILFPKSPDNIKDEVDVRRYIEAFLVPAQIFVRTGCDGVVADAEPVEKKSPLLFRIPLIPYRYAFPVTRRVACLFSTPYLFITLPFIVLSHLGFFWMERVVRPVAGRGALTAGEWMGLIALVYGLLVVHEFGHVAACSRYKVEHGEIGFGVYWIWPVLYADVTPCWRLTRRSRAVVDIGGIYFHLIACGICCVYWLIDQNPIIRILIHSVMLTVIVNLNPFLRFDGYWLLADLTGLPSLYTAAGDVCVYVFDKMFARVRHIPPPAVLSIPPLERGILVLYSLGLVLFTILVTFELLLLLPTLLANTLPSAVVTMLAGLRVGQWNWSGIRSALTACLIVWGCYRISCRMCRIAIKMRSRVKDVKVIQSEC